MRMASRLTDAIYPVRASKTTSPSGEALTSVSRSARARRSSRWVRVYSPVAESYTLCIPARGLRGMTLYGYARVSVREPEDKNLDLQVERLVRAGCAMGNIRSEEASGAKNDRGGLLEILDLVVEGDTLVVTHIDRLSRGLTYGLQVIEDLHLGGVEFRSLAEDFDTSTANGKLQLVMVLAFSEWWRNSIRERSIAGQHKAKEEGRFPGRPTVLTERQKEYVREELAKGVSQRELARVLEVSRWKIQQMAEGAPGAAVS